MKALRQWPYTVQMIFGLFGIEIADGNNNMKNENILEEIKTLIEDKCGINRKRITADARISEDLKITGTDAVELILLFSKQFNVDVSKFKSSDYFEPEGMNMLMPNTIPNRKILKVSDLENAIKAGRIE